MGVYTGAVVDISGAQSSESPDRFPIGNGSFGEWEWELIYWLSVRHGPVVMFGSPESHTGQCPSERLVGPFGWVGDHQSEYDDGSLSVNWLVGEVRAGYDRVVIECDDGSQFEASVVDCQDRLGFNIYVAVTRSWPVRVLASAPDGANAVRQWSP